jgi:hypothetical protein
MSDAQTAKPSGISPARRKFLCLLVERGGVIMGAALSGVSRSAVRKMQRDGLVRLEPPPVWGDPNSEDLSAWKIYITEAGRSALLLSGTDVRHD